MRVLFLTVIMSARWQTKASGVTKENRFPPGNGFFCSSFSPSAFDMKKRIHRRYQELHVNVLVITCIIGSPLDLKGIANKQSLHSSFRPKNTRGVFLLTFYLFFQQLYICRKRVGLRQLKLDSFSHHRQAFTALICSALLI